MTEPQRIRRVLGWAYFIGGPVIALVVLVGGVVINGRAGP